LKKKGGEEKKFDARPKSEDKIARKRIIWGKTGRPSYRLLKGRRKSYLEG